MTMVRKTISSLFLAQFASASLQSCGYFAQQEKVERLVVSYAGITGGRGPLWIAKELKLFEKYGLDARLVQITAGTTSINAFDRG